MANTHETTADIIAEMRGIRIREFQDYADRLEAAYRREKAAIEADALEVGGIVEAAHRREISERVTRAVKNTAKIIDEQKRVGDAAKLREALEFCVKGMCGFCRMDAEARGMTTECVNGCEALRKAKAALAAPARNCDVGTAKNQTRRFSEFCGNYDQCMTDDCKCPLLEKQGTCEFEWAQMPYEEGGDK